MQWCNQNQNDNLCALKTLDINLAHLDPSKVFHRPCAMKSEHWITKAFGFYYALPKSVKWLKANHFTSLCLVFPVYLSGDSNTYVPTSQRCCEAYWLGPDFYMDLKSNSSLATDYLNGECSQISKFIRVSLLMQIIVALVMSGCSSWKCGPEYLWFLGGSCGKSMIAGQRIQFWYCNIKLLRFSLLVVHIWNACLEYILESTDVGRMLSLSQEINTSAKGKEYRTVLL